MRKFLYTLLGLIFIASNIISISANAQYGGGLPSYQAWTSYGRGSNITFSTTSAATLLPTTGLIARICNLGTVTVDDAYIAFGTVNTISVTAANGSWLKGGTCGNYNLQPFAATHYTYIAALCVGTCTCSSPACQLYVETGIGASVPGQ